MVERKLTDNELGYLIYRWEREAYKWYVAPYDEYTDYTKYLNYYKKEKDNKFLYDYVMEKYKGTFNV